MSNGENAVGLSKTSLLKGKQCPNALYISTNPPADKISPDPYHDAKFQAGYEVGVLARQLFPGGTEEEFSGLSLPKQIEETSELIAAIKNAYSAGLSFLF